MKKYLLFGVCFVLAATIESCDAQSAPAQKTAAKPLGIATTKKQVPKAIADLFNADRVLTSAERRRLAAYSDSLYADSRREGMKITAAKNP
jgi:hypothetical protein